MNSQAVCARVRLGCERVDDGGILLTVTKWRVIGFNESEVVRWPRCRRLSNEELQVQSTKVFFPGKRVHI
jgi:hypothetical protein